MRRYPRCGLDGGVSVTKKQHVRAWGPSAGFAKSLITWNRTTGGSAPDLIVTLVTRPSPGAPPPLASVENHVQSGWPEGCRR